MKERIGQMPHVLVHETAVFIAGLGLTQITSSNTF